MEVSSSPSAQFGTVLVLTIPQLACEMRQQQYSYIEDTEGEIFADFADFAITIRRMDRRLDNVDFCMLPVIR
jgi:hypothetical protein